MSPCVKLWRERHVIVGVAVNEKLYAVLKSLGSHHTRGGGALFYTGTIASPITEKNLVGGTPKRDRKTRE